MVAAEAILEWAEEYTESKEQATLKKYAHEERRKDGRNWESLPRKYCC